MGEEEVRSHKYFFMYSQAGGHEQRVLHHLRERAIVYPALARPVAPRRTRRQHAIPPMRTKKRSGRQGSASPSVLWSRFTPDSGRRSALHVLCGAARRGFSYHRASTGWRARSKPAKTFAEAVLQRALVFRDFLEPETLQDKMPHATSGMICITGTQLGRNHACLGNVMT